jgi:intracellular septation protein A
MHRLRALMGFASEFIGLIAFWLLAWAFGTKTAIGGTIVIVLTDMARRLWTRAGFTRIYWLSTGLTVILGAADLLSRSPHWLPYEAPVTNLATGIAFAAGAFGAKPLVQEFAEQQRRTPFPDRTDIRRFFQLFTLLWAAYFVIKAAVYFWLALVLPLQQAVALRSVIGGVSLAAMVLLSLQGERLFRLCKRARLLPEPTDQPA